MNVSVCIPTHNRLAELRRTLAALTKLEPPPHEIIVTADGCTDGTPDFLRAEHPSVKLIIHATACGSIASRNEMFAAATGEIILTLDDDSYPMEPDAIARITTLFQNNPRLGAADFPQVTDEEPSTLGRELADFQKAHFRGFYVSAAAAFRSRLVREAGPLPTMFFHMYEEPDFCLRLLAAGWQVRWESVLRIRHHWSATGRSEMRNHHRHARNELWSVFMRCPLPWLPLVALRRIAGQFSYGLKRGWALREPTWWWMALHGLRECLRQRAPVPWRTYRAWMQLIREPHNDDAKWEAAFR